MDHNYYIYIYICNSYDPLITSYQLLTIYILYIQVHLNKLECREKFFSTFFSCNISKRETFIYFRFITCKVKHFKSFFCFNFDD